MIDLQFWAFLKLVKLLSRAPFKEAIGRRAGVDMVIVDMLMLWFECSGNVLWEKLRTRSLEIRCKIVLNRLKGDR